MRENTRNLGVVIGLSMALVSFGSVASAKPMAAPTPTLRSLDLKVSVPESSVSLGGPSSSETVFTRPMFEGFRSAGLGHGRDRLHPDLLFESGSGPGRLVRWGNRHELPWLFEVLDERSDELVLKASQLESPVVASFAPGREAVMLGLR